jgi:uncharacterized membrane protein
MNTAKKISGVALAATAATLFAIAPMNASAMKSGKCVGGNSCKGQSACATATTGCAGQNSCKSHGWVKTTKQECDAAGGTFEG